MSQKSKVATSRRAVLKSGIALGLTTLAAPFVNRAAAAGSLVVRTIGGAYEEAITKVLFDPFTQETGIEIQKLPATSGKLLAMLQSGGAAEIDVLDIGETEVILFARQDALAPIDYDSWTNVSADDLDEGARLERAVGHDYYSAILGYNTAAVSPDKAPKNWAEFWDAERFPGPRMLADISSGYVDLEQALLADGVAPADLYPLDIERALKSMSRIRPHIRKFWDTGALSAQLLVDQEAVMGSIWNTRLQAAVDAGAPLAPVWDGGMLRMQCWAIANNSANKEAAQRYVAFALAPERQAAVAELIPQGPTNKRAFEFVSAARAAILPSHPDNAAKQVHQDVEWWADNRPAVVEAWSKWLLENK